MRFLQHLDGFAEPPALDQPPRETAGAVSLEGLVQRPHLRHADEGFRTTARPGPLFGALEGPGIAPIEIDVVVQRMRRRPLEVALEGHQEAVVGRHRPTYPRVDRRPQS